MKSILNINIKRRGQKLNLWGAISANGIVTLQIFEKNLNTKNIRILNNRLDEFREMSKNNHVELLIDNFFAFNILLKIIYLNMSYSCSERWAFVHRLL